VTDYAIEGLRRLREPVRPVAPAPRTRPHKLEVPFDVHRAILAGRAPGTLDRGKPGWSAGDAVRVSTATRPDDRRTEDPVTVTVTDVLPVMVSDLAAEHARRVGLALATDVQRLALDLPLETPAAHVNMAARTSKATVWLTGWTRVEHDAVRLVRDAGWQAPSGPLQWRPIDAGEAVADEYQRVLCDRAQPDIQSRTERAAAVNAKRLRVSKAKRATVHREATRRRRIETARTQNSSVVEEPSATLSWPSAFGFVAALADPDIIVAEDAA
jgi:hypothetical protein